MAWMPSLPRQIPVKVATAPMSVRPAVSRAISAPMSKSSRCSRTVTSSSGHRREECDLARPADGCIGLDVGLVDRRADDLRVFRRIGVFLTAPAQPGHEIADRAHAGRRIDLLLRLADALAHPRKINELHTRTLQARGDNTGSVVDQMTHARAEIVPARI